MELKWDILLDNAIARLRFNRTFMELKSAMHGNGHCKSCVLIVPLWN